MTPRDPPSPPSDAADPRTDHWSPTDVSRLVHELRTPLASLRIAAEMIADAPTLPAALAGAANGLHAAVGELDELLDQLGEINRIRGGRSTAARAPLELARLLADVVKATSADVAAAGAVLSIAAAPAAGAPATGDERRLARALGCLVRSACAAGARHVELVARSTGAALLLEVRDDAPPPSPEERARLFEPFEPTLRARRRSGGTGLGLTLAHALARLLGGELEVAVDGDRTVLRLSLPG